MEKVTETAVQTACCLRKTWGPEIIRILQRFGLEACAGTSRAGKTSHDGIASMRSFVQMQRDQHRSAAVPEP